MSGLRVLALSSRVSRRSAASHYGYESIREIDLGEVGASGDREGAIALSVSGRTDEPPLVEFLEVGVLDQISPPKLRAGRVRRLAAFATDARGLGAGPSSYVQVIEKYLTTWAPSVLTVHVGLAFDAAGDAICQALAELDVQNCVDLVMFEGGDEYSRRRVLSCPASAKIDFAWVNRYDDIREIYARYQESIALGNLSSVPLAHGLAASPGQSSGKAYFNRREAVAAARIGIKVILVISEASPEDVTALMESDGVLASRGGLVGHAAVASRGFGIPAVVGADALSVGESDFVVGGQRVRAGDTILIDGDTGEVRRAGPPA